MNENVNIFITTRRLLYDLHQKEQHAAEQLQFQRHQKAACLAERSTPLSDSVIKIPIRSKVMIYTLAISNILTIQIPQKSSLVMEESTKTFSVVIELYRYRSRSRKILLNLQ
ncbi:hypothetical protein AVEN_165965-1 [Araneus ventricosus]|uniref:Uncharacterized protein n=1 Tax=Araneus ventricosus TaxID=182803 RepID=A0A4Y2P1X1_ARAVE|nr:hypothetical protein AVEN_165965-1 [Araneus ventricosus]